MKSRLLKKKGMWDSRLALVRTIFGEDWSWGASRDESRKMFDHFLEASRNPYEQIDSHQRGW